jgi:hypothetical protein
MQALLERRDQDEGLADDRHAIAEQAAGGS